MNITNNYILFLQEYKKLLERGVKNIFIKSVLPNFIWIDDIQRLINDELCESILTEIFTENFDSTKSLILSLKKPLKPKIIISFEFQDDIEFNEVKNKFESENQEVLITFNNSEKGIIELEKLKRFKENKSIYSKLYRAFNDIKNDSNVEIVLSVGLIQYSKGVARNTNSISKTNQHLFHFPLKIELTLQNKINLSFSDIDKPYSDFFFLNNTPIEKRLLDNIIDRFDEEVDSNGFQYIYDVSFKNNLLKGLQQISENSTFENSIFKPKSDTTKIDSFNILYSPAINIKRKKPRFFNKLTNDIIEYNNENENEAELFNLLIRNPENEHNNSFVKPNYFIDELFEEHKEKTSNLNAEEDFSVFFPLPYNKEQKQIYDNYLKNRITVVTGPPGTGKSHTIVNILCSLLAQGKRVLVTAQTDKALESLLDKIPTTFNDLIFTKIQLENDKTRFSLEKSISNIRSILIDDFHLNVEKKISELDTLKGEYTKSKSEIYTVLEKEYTEITLNNSFKNLRSYKLWDKFQSKNTENWNWIKDDISIDLIDSFDEIKSIIDNFLEYSTYENKILKDLDIDLLNIWNKLENFNFTDFLDSKKKIIQLQEHLDIDELSKNKLLKIDLDSIINITEKYSNTDIIISSYHKINQLNTKIKLPKEVEVDYSSNLEYNKIIKNASKYLRDIESYLAQIEGSKDKITFLNKFKGKYKRVSYLEDTVLNSNNCDNRKSIIDLKNYINQIQKIDSQLTLISKSGFDIEINEDSNLITKTNLLNESIEKVNRNYAIVYELQNNKNLTTYSNIFNIDLSDIEKIYNSAFSYKEDLQKLKQYEIDVVDKVKVLKKISKELINSKLNFRNFCPLNEISNKEAFKELQAKIVAILLLIEREEKFNNSKKQLKEILPKTISKLKNVAIENITKENFEFAHANSYFTKNEIIDLQKTKEKLSQINSKIYEVKSEILFDLAKENFRNSFSSSEIDDFINLLEKYKTNILYSNKGIKDKVKFQILARKNSAKISNRLSCWVMKFNDVLNSVDSTPEIFDCIIVDEASQLDFNSVLLGYYTKNMIIVGDDKQTSPSALTGANDNDFQIIKNTHLDFLGDERVHIRSDNSLFSLAKMIAGGSTLSLIEHFRSVSEIIEFSKHNFYDDLLRPLKQINTENRLEPLKSVYIPDSFLEDKIVYSEIETIKKYLIEMMNNPIYHNKTIGVVSLGLSKHTERLKDIKEELSEIFGRDTLDRFKLTIEDSPKFQGDERDVMLVSLGVATDLEKAKDNANPKPRAIVDDGKLKDETKKINVALSRAKEQMILFHSVKSNDLRNNDFRQRIIKFFNTKMKELEVFELPNNESERNLYNIPKPFDSWFEYDITSNLIENGYQYIQPQYKVKENELFYNHHKQKETYVNFKLDLVVTNNGKMIAIECDGDPFHSLPEDIAYDVERQEFLERVGWKVYRILYSAYKRNPSLEIEKMIDFIEQNTKKDKIITFSNNVIQESNDDCFEDEINTDEYEIDTSEDKAIEEISFTEKHNNTDILIYFNLYKGGDYLISDNSSDNALYSIPIKEDSKNGFILHCYDTGRINKVPISVLLRKKKDKIYMNGYNTNSTISSIHIIDSDEIMGIFLIKNNQEYFKAHLTEKVSVHHNLVSQGNKVVYEKYDKCTYKTFPIELKTNIDRLIFNSFTAKSKATNSPTYETEWSFIKINDLEENTQSHPNLFNRIVEFNSKVKLRFLNNQNLIKTVQITEVDISNTSNGIQNIKPNSPLAISILNKTNGEKVKIINTENMVEIVEIIE